MGILKLRNSIFGRLVKIFLVIMIPIYMLGIYIYYWGQNTVRQEISKSTIAQVSFYLEGLDKEIERIIILQYGCLTDDNPNKLAIRYEVLNNYEKSESMNQLQKRLVTIQNSSIYIKDVSAHIRPFGKTISSTNGVNFINAEKYRNIRVPPGITGAQIINYQGGFYLSTYQQSNLILNNSLYLIEIELNQDALKSALAQFTTYDGSGSFLIDLTNDGIITSEANIENEQLIDNLLSSLSPKGNSSMELVNINDEDYFVVYEKNKGTQCVMVDGETC